jgi:hypothetical protein
MKFEVTDYHIDNGIPVDICNCMIGLALKEVITKPLVVTIYTMFCVSSPQNRDGIDYKLSELGLSFLYKKAKAFDDWKAKRGPRPEPFSFHISAECFMK